MCDMTATMVTVHTSSACAKNCKLLIRMTITLYHSTSSGHRGGDAHLMLSDIIYCYIYHIRTLTWKESNFRFLRAISVGGLCPLGAFGSAPRFNRSTRRGSTDCVLQAMVACTGVYSEMEQKNANDTIITDGICNNLLCTTIE